MDVDEEMARAVQKEVNDLIDDYTVRTADELQSLAEYIDGCSSEGTLSRDDRMFRTAVSAELRARARAMTVRSSH